MTEITKSVTVTVNGTAHTATVEARTLLSDFLRHEIGLTGTHIGCEQGVCGACTVLLDGRPIRSCLLFAVQTDGREVETVEALAGEDDLSGVQRAMRDQHGLQCGFCTPGILMSLAAADRANLPEADVCEDVLGGHVCRCTGYAGIRKAVQQRWSGKVGQQ